MKTVYLPLEIPNRELMARAFMATSLAKDDCAVYVFEHTLFDRIGWPSQGIYIGKNCFRTEVPYTTKYYNKMKKSKVDLWYLDEEGGVYSGNKESQKEILDHRLNSGDLDENDKILTWGLWQKDAFKSKKPSAKILVSGSPNFDILQPKYKDILLNWDLKVTRGKKNFILVNTRFSQGNPKYGIKHIFNTKQPHSEKLPEFYMEEAYIAHNKIMFNMIELCIFLAKSLPDEQIIIRPHPGESKEVYEILTKKIKNILVISEGGVESWIRMSKVLIHNGCTTAIQAIIAKKNVITYISKNVSDTESAHTAFLPNTIGRVSRTHKDVLCNLTKVHENLDKSWMNTISNLDSIEFISKLVGGNICSQVEGSIHVSEFNAFSFFREKLKDFFRSVTNRIVPDRERKGFDYKEFSKIVDLVDIANHYYGSNVKCKKISNGCYCICK